MSKQSFFQDFEPVSKKQWLERIQKDLKGADFEEKLVWHTEEGFDVMPFYNVEDLSELSHLKQLHHQDYQPESAFLGARRWQYCQEVAVTEEKKANAIALDALNQGAEAICFDLTACKGNPQWATLFRDIQWAYCSIAFKALDEQASMANSFVQYWQSLALPAEQLSGFWQAVSLDGNKIAGKYFSPYPNFQGISLNSNAGHTKVSEKIGNLVYQFYACITDAQTASNTLQNSCFHYALDNNYFFQIAGLRALKLLINGMLQSYGAQTADTSITIRAITSIEVSEATKQDPEWNMLSNTSQAMSGILGGCQYLSILPHNQGIAETDRFSERIARNVSNLLREESYFDKVADPVAGAYYIEYLTEQLAANAWQYFQDKL